MLLRMVQSHKFLVRELAEYQEAAALQLHLPHPMLQTIRQKCPVQPQQPQSTLQLWRDLMPHSLLMSHPILQKLLHLWLLV